jgi:hypothetical protein
MKKGEAKVSSLHELLSVLEAKGTVPCALQNRVYGRYELGEVSASPDDGFAMHEVIDVVTFEGRKIDVLVKSYFFDGSYAGNAIVVLSPLRVCSIVRVMLGLRESGKIHFDTVDLYCDPDQAEGALIFGRRLVVKFFRGRDRRSNNYYVDTIEGDKSEVGGKVTDFAAVAMVETVLERWILVVLKSGRVPMTMKKLNRQLNKPSTRPQESMAMSTKSVSIPQQSGEL